MSVFRIEKSRTAATVTLSNGGQIQGAVFVAGGNPARSGPECVRDVLNAESGFFPFEVDTASGLRTYLYNRAHVVCVAVDGNEEPRLEPGYHVATSRSVAMLLSNGRRLEGVVRVYRPQGHDRLSDFVRTRDSFIYLERPGTTFIVNVQHLIELTEISES